MINFKEFASGLNLSPIINPSVQVSLRTTGHVLYLKFDSKDILTSASYTGPLDTWLGSLCSLILGKSLFDMTHLGTKDWDKAFAQDQTFWDLKSEIEEDLFFVPLELLKSALDIYRGREYLYKEPEALICRCFGVRENDVLDYIRSTKDPTPEGLGAVSKAGMGCRSCVPQLTKWLSINLPKSQARFYKEKPRADWLLEIDDRLQRFPEANEWKMEVESFHGTQVTITFNKKVSQSEEEEVSVRLQDFLGEALDAELGFFLILAQHRSNA